MQEEKFQTDNQPGLDAKQKFAIAFLGIVGVFFIVLWIIQFNQKLKAPFSYNEADLTVPAPAQPQEDSISALKSKDTDGDGLSDYDELYIYHTSPYLADSDSDGIPDGEEIKNGTDPNCPEGKRCSATDALLDQNKPATASSSQNIESLNALFGQMSGQGQGSGSSSTEQSQALLSGKLDAKSLRKALLDAGMNEKLLNALSDEQLLKSYQDTLSKTQQP